ncbi:hypothetical protein ACGFIR_27940 [Micromonospora sp. NPDC049051]
MDTTHRTTINAILGLVFVTGLGLTAVTTLNLAAGCSRWRSGSPCARRSS